MSVSVNAVVPMALFFRLVLPLLNFLLAAPAIANDWNPIAAPLNADTLETLGC